MHCTLLLHSTTGNTRLVARHAAAHLERTGHTCVVHDIVRQPEPPSLEQTELLIVAAPTMYFRVTKAMEQFVARLPRPPGGPRPALLLATAAGEPGAHFELLARQLQERGWVTLGARWLMMPTNWPPHRHLARLASLAEPLAALVARVLPASRILLAVSWPDLGLPSDDAPERLARWLDRMVDLVAAAPPTAADPAALHRGLPGMALLGRKMTVEMMRKGTDPRVIAERCARCGTCVAVCPSGCITRADAQAVPRVGEGCTGCWACFNHCPEGAIDAWLVPPGTSQYRAPDRALRRLFRSSE
jgi:ferredoxin